MDGAQSRDFILGELTAAGVKITELEPGIYELVDLDGDAEVLYLDDPVVARMVIHLWRRFGQMCSMIPQDLVEKKPVH